jgi:hypothetical protein
MKDVGPFEHSMPPMPFMLPLPFMLKTYEPLGIAFWENQEGILEGMQEFSDGWFRRRHSGTQAALDAAKRICEASTPTEMIAEYQNWLRGSVERMAEDGVACQQHLTRLGSLLNSQLSRATDDVMTNAASAAKKTSISLKAA